MSNLRENIDYEFIPVEDDGWDVRILVGDFVETVIRIGVLEAVPRHGKCQFVWGDDFDLKYNFEVMVNPSDSTNLEISPLVGDIIASILHEQDKTVEATKKVKSYRNFSPLAW